MATDRKNDNPTTPARIFVGRQQELEEFAQILRNPEGQAILVVGQAGMGKTWLIEEMVNRAENGTLFHGEPGPKCWAVSYDIWPTDSVNRVIEQIVADACEAAQPIRQALGLTGDKKDKWRALLGTAGLIPGFGPPLEKLGGLFLTLVNTPPRDTYDAFMAAMRKMSECLSEQQRALFIVDPRDTMPPRSDHLWKGVVRELPDKIKLVFAQRPYDVLVNNLEFCHLPNVVCLPREAEQLHGLDEGAVEELADLYARSTGLSGSMLRDAVRQYSGHAYSLVAALELLRQGTKPEVLPKDPRGIAAAQWKEICKAGSEAICLFKAYAILEVPIPPQVVRAVAQLDADTCQSLMAHDYLGGLLRREETGNGIYHALLADHLINQIDDEERRTYHHRAAEIYRARLKAEPKPDALSAERLPRHVLASEGTEEFTETLIETCTAPLVRLGRFDTLIELSSKALRQIEEGTPNWAVIAGNLGFVYQTRGDLAQAEQMHRQSLEINKKLGRLEGMASNYGNLGVVCGMRGDLAQAEQMFREALKISRKLRRFEGVASQYGNLGNVYYTRNDLEQAEQMYRKALKIDKELGRLEGMANDYGNLGNVYYTRRDLDRAEQMYHQALKIDEKLDRLVGMVNHCVNLGTIYKERGDLGKACECWERAIELYRKIGMPHMVEKVQGILAELESKNDTGG